MSTVGIVTGAGRGMGKACALALAGTVDTLILADLDAGAAAATAKELSGTGPGSGSGSAEAFAGDVSSPADMERLAARASALGTLRSVAHAAGISPTMAPWDRVLRVDLYGTALLTESLRGLVGPGTAFVCFASMAPLLSPHDGSPEADAALDSPLDPEMPARVRAALGESVTDPGIAYSWAKRGVQRFAAREAAWFGARGARICSVSPGVIDTPQGRQEAQAHASMARLLRLTPLAREGEAAEVASVVAFLLSDAAAYVTGIDLPVDGGVTSALRHTPR